MALDDPDPVGNTEALPPIPDRSDDRSDDREDDTDRAIKLARTCVVEAVELLIMMMRLDGAAEERMRAATTILEVAGCL